MGVVGGGLVLGNLGYNLWEISFENDYRGYRPQLKVAQVF